MKKFTTITLALVLALGLFSNVQAQEEGESVAGLGIGFASYLGGNSNLPPISLSYDYGYNDKISIGGYLGYSSASEDLGFVGTWNYTYIIVAARGLYHFEIIDNIDTYGGLLLGYNIASSEIEGGNNGFLTPATPTVGGVLYGAFIGGRYALTDQFGVFLELGYGIAAVNVGVNFKF